MATLVSEEFHIVVPAEATNEVTNPSFETGTTGYTAVGAGVAIARSTVYQRRGLYSLEVTPASGVQSGAYFGTVNEVSGESRTFSVDVLGVAGQAMRIGIYTTGGAMLSETTFTANGYWQRVTVTRAGNASTTRRLYVLRDSAASTAKFYVDGLYYSSINGTYLDGDMKGFLPSRAEYRWNGTSHASTSWRSSQTRSGGTLLRIKDYARILRTLGLGMAPVVNIAQALTTDASSYQTTRVTDREFILALALDGLTPGDVQAKRQALIAAVRPDLTAYRQPLVIRYQGLDAAGGDASEPVDIACLYVDGLQDQPPGPGFERANARFISYASALRVSGDRGAVLGFASTVSNFSNIGYRDLDGTWKAMGTGTNDEVDTILTAPDGSLYVSGFFTSAGGVASTQGIAKWDGAAWSSIGTANGSVYALVVAPDGGVYAGGTFTTIGGVAANRVARWDGAAWTALGTGMNATVDSLSMDTSGNLYAGGSFTTAGGGAANRIARWNGSTWSALGTGFSGGSDRILAIAVSPDGSVYAGGIFTSAGGVSANNIARWNGSAWSALSTGVNNNVLALKVGVDGTLYVGGLFTTAGSISAASIARWNGVGWYALGEGVSGGSPNVLETGPDGLLYAGGDFTSAGGLSLPDRGAAWNGSSWTPFDLDTATTSRINAIAFDPAGRLYIGGLWGSSASVPSVTAVTVGGNAQSYPVIKVTGPGRLWQIKNATTGRAIYFTALTLQAGEVVTIDLRPGQLSARSSWRGDVMRYVYPGSCLDFSLLGGANNLSAFMTGTTAASAVSMTWQDLYWSIDGAKR